MFDVLIKALGFVIVIVIGFLLKQFRILKKEDGYTLATIIMNVTLPCALFSNDDQWCYDCFNFNGDYFKRFNGCNWVFC